MISRTRNGISDMRAVGANPTVLAVDPSTAAALDLAEQPGDNNYIFPSRSTGEASPLWGVRVVESPALDGHLPLLLDPAMIGVLYLGAMRFDADPYSKFTRNLTTLRVETTGLFHVGNADGALALEAAS